LIDLQYIGLKTKTPSGLAIKQFMDLLDIVYAQIGLGEINAESRLEVIVGH